MTWSIVRMFGFLSSKWRSQCRPKSSKNDRLKFWTFCNHTWCSGASSWETVSCAHCGHSQGSTSNPQWTYHLSSQYLLNHLTFLNETWYVGVSSWPGFLSSSSRSRCGLKSSKHNFVRYLLNQTWYSGASWMVRMFHGSFWLLSSWPRSQWRLKSSGNVFGKNHKTWGGILPLGDKPCYFSDQMSLSLILSISLSCSVCCSILCLLLVK